MNTKSNVRATTLEGLQPIIENFISPIPTKATLRDWFAAAKVPYFKANPTAKRGGGPVYYQVAAVEKMLRNRFRLT